MYFANSIIEDGRFTEKKIDKRKTAFTSLEFDLGKVSFFLFVFKLRFFFSI